MRDPDHRVRGAAASLQAQVDEHQIAFAMGEAIAHLHYLLAQGKVTARVDAGVRRFTRVS